MKTTTLIEEEKRKKKKNLGGRPKKELDIQQIETLAEIQCTMEEIAAVMRVDRDTLERRYMDEIKRGRERGKTLLRRAQWKKAISENSTAMQIWLGKVWLGQSDREPEKKSTCMPEARELLRLWTECGDDDVQWQPFDTIPSV